MAVQPIPPREHVEQVEVRYDLAGIDDAGNALYQLHGRGPTPPQYRLIRPGHKAQAWDVPGLGGAVRPRRAPVGLWRWLTGPDRRGWGRARIRR